MKTKKIVKYRKIINASNIAKQIDEKNTSRSLIYPDQFIINNHCE